MSFVSRSSAAWGVALATNWIVTGAIPAASPPRRASDFIGSTTGIINYAAGSTEKEFIIATEAGIIHHMQKLVPDKTFYAVPNLEGCSCNECPHMKLNTIDKMIAALETLKPEILLSEALRLRALKPLERMLELS